VVVDSMGSFPLPINLFPSELLSMVFLNGGKVTHLPSLLLFPASFSLNFWVASLMVGEEVVAVAWKYRH